MELNVLAKTQDEALQIVEQIIPTFTPEFTVAIKDMEGTGNSVDVPITLQDITIQDEYEGDYETRRTLIYTLNFTMKIRFVGETKATATILTVDSHLHDNTVTTKTISDDPLESVRSQVTSDSPFKIQDTFGFDSP